MIYKYMIYKYLICKYLIYSNMEVEFESVPLRILELFKFYLSDQEIKSVLASCPKSEWTLNGCM